MEHEITVSAGSILALVSLVTAVGVIFGVIFAVYRWVLKQNKQDTDIRQMKEENTLIVYALSACLDGLQQLGAGPVVSAAKDKLDKYINKQAHK